MFLHLGCATHIYIYLATTSSQNGMNCFMLASENGHKEVALAALGDGADKNGKSNVGWGV